VRRVGVFVCWCGSNIAKTVDVAGLAAEAAKLPGVVYATDYKYMCSEPGQKMIQAAIQEHHLDAVVVASCSPTLHESTFQRCIADAGLNPYVFQMANIREQCSWVHSDRDLATAKALDQTAIAVGTATKGRPLARSEVPITKRALVIGAGIAGIQAALDLAEAGYPVTVVERQPSIGGRMAQFDKTFPTMDCAACILTPKMVDAAKHPKITLLTWSEVEKVAGYVGNFEVTIRRRARSVNAEKCIGCGVCEEKCPSKVTSEFDAGLGTRKAIFRPFPQAVPNVPVIDRDHCRYFKTGKCGVCAKVCPAEAVDYDQGDELLSERFGAIVVATGCDLYDPARMTEYGGGRFADIVTGAQFERLVNVGGPTEGHIVRLSNHEEPKTVVFIQCVGSRDDTKGYPYCSKVCCMYTAKHATLVKEKLPQCEVYVFYMDIRAAGKGYEEFVRRAQEELGVKYLRGRVSRIYPAGDKLRVKGADSLAGVAVEIDADLVVLATALRARDDVAAVARMLNIQTDQYGFFTEAHPKLRPVENIFAGIYLAGACQYPRDIPDTVAAASAVAGKVCGLFARDSILSEAKISEVNVARCSGCLTCKEICPYDAIESEIITDRITREERTVAKVNEAVCQGCGACVAACRAAALNLRGFTDEQILAGMEALCRE
jgi:heterodisulfide reductase subunit A